MEYIVSFNPLLELKKLSNKSLDKCHEKEIFHTVKLLELHAERTVEVFHKEFVEKCKEIGFNYKSISHAGNFGMKTIFSITIKNSKEISIYFLSNRTVVVKDNRNAFIKYTQYTINF